MQIRAIECPFCGSKGIDRGKFFERTGFEIEKTMRWNGEIKVILRLGELAIESQKRTGQDTINKEKLLEMMQEEHKRLDERHRELEQNRKNIAKEQRETFEGILKQRKELEDKQREIINQMERLNKLKEEVLTVNSIKIPEALMEKIKEIDRMARERDTGMIELLQKMIYNVKTAGTVQEFQLTRRLKGLNIGDKIEHLGGANEEDILITVKENDKELGKIRVDSKKVKKWDSKFIDKMNMYLKANEVDFGVIATTAMPKNAVGSDFVWEGKNILIVEQKTTEAVYLICRYLLIKNAEYLSDYEKKTALLRENQKRLEAIKRVIDKSSFREFLNLITEEIVRDNKNIDDLENFITTKVKSFRDSNYKIMKQVNAALDNNQELQKALAESCT